MALINCQECGKEISDKATYCPNCGCPVKNVENLNPAMQALPNRKKMSKKKQGCLIAIFLFLFALISLIFVFAMLISSTYNQNDTATILETETLSKEDAQSIDSDIWGYVYPVIKVNNDLIDTMTEYTKGKISELEFYNLTNNCKDFAQEIWLNPPKVANKNAKQYLGSCSDYILYLQTLSESILKYLDSKKTSDLSKMQENIKQCSEAAKAVAINRGVFLASNNFTQEEIQKIVADSMDLDSE